jgi:hypothetical protein
LNLNRVNNIHMAINFPLLAAGNEARLERIEAIKAIGGVGRLESISNIGVCNF